MISPRNTAIGMLFQLTPSRRATSSSPALVTARTISTHALTEGDIVTFLSVVVFAIFQLTPSRRATTALIWFVNHFYNFNSRPHGGRRSRKVNGLSGKIFQLTPSRRATLRPLYHTFYKLYFNSRPHGGRPNRPGGVLFS